jgi:hypothetical protein
MAKEKVSEKVRMNAEEIKGHLTDLVAGNRHIQKQGKIPIGLNIEGEAGLGKTSVVMQFAEENGLQMVKRNLAEIEDLGDLVGFPLKQFQLCKAIKDGETECIWVDEPAVMDYQKQGYNFTGKKRMTYCPPEWVADKPDGGILFLDDFSRADSRMIQAAMEIINRQQYLSWSLPKDWHIIMSSNPDNGSYMVNSQDIAHQTRYCTIEMKFDVECWARQAEKDQIDGRCINFMLKHPELMKDDAIKEGINPRAMTNFFNRISFLGDFEKSLGKVQEIGESSIGHTVTTTFTTFIHQKLDKLISPKEMLEKDWKIVKAQLIDSCGKGSTYRPDIASIMTTRLMNYALFYAEKNTVDQKMIDRLILLTTDDDLLAMDLKYVVIRELLNKNKAKFQKLMLNAGIVKMTVK